MESHGWLWSHWLIFLSSLSAIPTQLWLSNEQGQHFLENIITHLNRMQTNSIKKVNLEHLQRPKTLIVIHYRSKRVSIPLFEPVDNITEYLYHQLQKFQHTVLAQQKEKEKDNREKRHKGTLGEIVGFTALEQDRSKIDIKMNILLSMSRLGKDYGRSRMDVRELDITNYYKYLEIQPYYGSHTKKQLIPEYQLYSVLNKGPHSTTYLGRRLSDGRFYSIKMLRNDSKLAQNEYHAMKTIHQEQSQFENKGELELIPQIEEIRKVEGLFIFICEYCPGGSLRTAVNRKLSEIECLHYMKQLVWGIHTLHSNFNLIHRALCFENLQLDFVSNLRLTNFAYCQPCYSNNYLAHSNVPESYEQRYEIPHVITPPEVQRSSRYNNLIDYYGIGAVLLEMYSGGSGSGNGRPSAGKKQKEGIEIAIENLMAENIRDREMFANQIISELHEEKMRLFANSSKREIIEHERLSFNKIYTGDSINVQEKTNNGIKHEDALKIMKPSCDDQIYYLNPVNKSRKKSKNKSKSKEKSKQKKPKSKSKDKGILGNKNNQSRSLAGSQKSLNKSVDSRNNSVKSGKSNQSIEKNKTKVLQDPCPKKIIPKIPTPVSAMLIKSPPKSPLYHTTLPTNARSPPKLTTNKSKNKL